MSDYYEDEDDELTPEEQAAYQQQLVNQAWAQAEENFIYGVDRLQKQLGYELTNRELQILHVDWQRSPDPSQYNPGQAFDELFDPIDPRNDEQRTARTVEYMKDAEQEADAAEPTGEPAPSESMWTG